jgi:diguanylate cyclase (GGDEF)-like protein
MARRHWGIVAATATFDAEHARWFVDDAVNCLFVTGVAWLIFMARRSYEQRQEITRRRRAEDLAQQFARHDTLTGLPNRRLLQETATRSLVELRDGGALAVMLIDLDGFKAVNDGYGHAIGDAILCQAAMRLTRSVGDRGMVARMGGDEFVIVTQAGVDTARLVQIADRVVRELTELYFVQERRISIGASAGIAIYPNDGDTVSLLLHSADLAMYRAKEVGYGSFRFFEPDMDQDLRDHALLKLELREAIGSGQIVPFYQPLINLASQEVDGFEVLARWNHPTRGLLEPSMFIALAEDLKLITPLAVALFRQVCADAREWPSQYRLSLNISPSQLSEPDLFISIAKMMDGAGIAVSRLEIEITESSLITDTPKAAQIIDELKVMGMTVVLDDFGTGYSSLYHLREINFDKIKIDRSFVQNIGRDPTAARYVEAMICLGKSLQLQTTAEGVEDASVLAKLVEFGCTFGQGFVFARPMSGQDIRYDMEHNTVFPLGKYWVRPPTVLPIPQ